MNRQCLLRFGMGMVVLLALLLPVLPASAARYDMNLGKFWEVCSATPGTFPGATNMDECANGLFKGLVNELGMITAPVFLAPAETLGLNGFEFSFEGTIAPIHNGQAYWTNAIEGSPQSVLFIPHIHVRKGLPFSFEVGTQLSYVPESELFVAGAELKWAINEGFYFIPDLVVRFSINHVVGPKDFELSSGGWDISLSKAFGIAGMFSLTPYAGYNMLFIHASSHVVLSLLDPDGAGPATEQFIGKVFNTVKWNGDSNTDSNMFHRFFVGLRLKTYIFQVILEGCFYTNSVNLFSFKLGFDY